MRRWLFLALPLLLGSGMPDPVIETWTKLPQSSNGCPDTFDYFPGGGLRILYCHATQTISLTEVASLAGVPIWLKGPHKKARLDLANQRSFGRYNPAFVEKLRTIALPASRDPSVMIAAQKTYNEVLRERARIAWVVHEKLVSDKTCAEREREAYRKNIESGSDPSYYERWYFYMNPGFCQDHPQEWYFNNGSDAGYEGNVTKTIVAWWMRRQMDGTEAQWVDFLREVLRLYDEQWLKAEPAPGQSRPL